MNNTIWLSGSRGFVGSYIRQSLVASGYRVISVSNSPSLSNDDSVVFVDFSKKDSIKRAVSHYGLPETFIHSGWGNVYDNQHKCHLTDNLQDGINLIDQLYECGLQKFILIGSSSEYGDRVGELKEKFLPTGELNNYIKGKLALATYGFEAAKKINRTFLHIKLFYAFGAGQRSDSLISQLFKNCLEERQMNLSPCEHYRDYIHTFDIAKGINKLVNVNESGIVNLGSGSVIQLKEFVKLFWKECNADPALLNFGSHDRTGFEPPQPRSYASLDNLKRLTKWHPSTSIENGIKDTVKQLYLNI